MHIVFTVNTSADQRWYVFVTVLGNAGISPRIVFFPIGPITFSVPDPRVTEAHAPDFPRRYRVVLDSDRRLPTIFAKMRPIDQKKGSGTTGTKTILGEMTA